MAQKKKGNKEKKEKEKKGKKEWRKTATVTSGDGYHGDPSLGPQSAIIIPDTVGDI